MDVSDSNMESSSKKSAIFQAAVLEDINLIHSLLNKGLDIDGQDEEGSTLLHYAAECGHLSLAAYLLEHQASVLVRNKKGRSALLEAYTRNHGHITTKILNML